MTKDTKNISVLFAVGLICLLFGSGLLYINMHLDVIGVAVFTIGLTCILLCLLRLKGAGQPLVRFSWLRTYGPLTGAVIALAVVAVGINYAAYRSELRWDFTRNKQHTLSQYTTEILRNLNDNVDLTTFHVGLPPKYLEDLFQEYARVGEGKVKTAIFDPLVDIGYAAQFGNVISG